jgi:hypothetical protein
MRESGHLICFTGGESSRCPAYRYLFEKEESKRKVTTSIFRKNGRRPYSHRGFHLQLYRTS